MEGGQRRKIEMHMEGGVQFLRLPASSSTRHDANHQLATLHYEYYEKTTDNYWKERVM